MKFSKYRFIKVNDNRNGLSIKVWDSTKLIIEIFRNDSDYKNEISIYEKNNSLELIEYAINYFKNKLI